MALPGPEVSIEAALLAALHTLRPSPPPQSEAPAPQRRRCLRRDVLRRTARAPFFAGAAQPPRPLACNTPLAQRAPPPCTLSQPMTYILPCSSFAHGACSFPLRTAHTPQVLFASQSVYRILCSGPSPRLPILPLAYVAHPDLASLAAPAA